MRLKRLGTAAMVPALLLLIGCQKEKSDERLGDIALRLEKQEGAVNRMAGRMEGIEGKLRKIRTWAQRSAEPKVAEFKDTPEYKQLAIALSDIQEKLNLTEGGLAETRKELDQERLRDPGQQLRAMADPQEFTKRLDALIETFGPKIEDPGRKQEFEADFQQLKQINLNNPTDEEFCNWCASDYRRRLTTEQDERKRQWMERLLQGLTSPPPERFDPDEFLATIRLNENMLRLWRIAKKHGVPGEALTEAGLMDLSGDNFILP